MVAANDLDHFDPFVPSLYCGLALCTVWFIHQHSPHRISAVEQADGLVVITDGYCLYSRPKSREMHEFRA